MTHWRINFYLAYALAKSGANAQAESLFQNIQSHLKEHELFLIDYLCQIGQPRL